MRSSRWALLLLMSFSCVMLLNFNAARPMLKNKNRSAPFKSAPETVKSTPASDNRSTTPVEPYKWKQLWMIGFYVSTGYLIIAILIRVIGWCLVPQKEDQIVKMPQQLKESAERPVSMKQAAAKSQMAIMDEKRTASSDSKEVTTATTTSDRKGGKHKRKKFISEREKTAEELLSVSVRDDKADRVGTAKRSLAAVHSSEGSPAATSGSASSRSSTGSSSYTRSSSSRTSSTSGSYTSSSTGSYSGGSSSGSYSSSPEGSSRREGSSSSPTVSTSASSRSASSGSSSSRA